MWYLCVCTERSVDSILYVTTTTSTSGGGYSSRSTNNDHIGGNIGLFSKFLEYVNELLYDFKWFFIVNRNRDWTETETTS